jgi:hypothetical protein
LSEEAKNADAHPGLEPELRANIHPSLIEFIALSLPASE